MDEVTIVEKLSEIFEDVFDEPIPITKNLSANDVEDWDSLNHINLITAIEEEFCVKFTLDDLQNQKTVGDTIDFILRKTVE